MPNQNFLLVRMVCTLVKTSTRGRKVSLDVHREHLNTASLYFTGLRKRSNIGNGM
nr:MAG TPA: hypothetical protein [Caudoviricetes sp.]